VTVLSGGRARRRVWSGLTAGLCLVLASALGWVLFTASRNPGERLVSYPDRGVAETGSINIVTAILMDYRGFDTLGEATVILASVAAAAMILGKPGVPRPDGTLGLLARQALAVMLPLFFVFPVYVVLYGHISPGGGFQGGVSLAVLVILIHVTFGYRFGQARIPLALLSNAEYLGAFAFAAVGFLGILTGGAYLSNALLQRMPSGGIIPLLNIIVGIKVAAGLSSMYLYLAGSEQS
jgi:multicomponent Na+:H+ antiporter subunit B